MGTVSVKIAIYRASISTDERPSSNCRPRARVGGLLQPHRNLLGRGHACSSAPVGRSSEVWRNVWQEPALPRFGLSASFRTTELSTSRLNGSPYCVRNTVRSSASLTSSRRASRRYFRSRPAPAHRSEHTIFFTLAQADQHGAALPASRAVKACNRLAATVNDAV